MRLHCLPTPLHTHLIFQFLDSVHLLLTTFAGRLPVASSLSLELLLLLIIHGHPEKRTLQRAQNLTATLLLRFLLLSNLPFNLLFRSQSEAFRRPHHFWEAEQRVECSSLGRRLLSRKQDPPNGRRGLSPSRPFSLSVAMGAPVNHTTKYISTNPDGEEDFFREVHVSVCLWVFWVITMSERDERRRRINKFPWIVFDFGRLSWDMNGTSGVSMIEGLQRNICEKITGILPRH